MCKPYRIDTADWNCPADQGDLAAIRRAVFIEEQRVPEALEWDGLDADAFHRVARDRTGQAIGSARMLRDGHIGRMAVTTACRGFGVGTALLRSLLQEATHRRLKSVYLDAQLHAISFYERLGFVAEGEAFMDAGIPHRRMVCRLKEHE